MSYAHDTVDSAPDDAESRLDARCVLIVFAVALFGFVLLISSFDGALGLPGLL